MDVVTLNSLRSIYQDTNECVLIVAALSPTGEPCLEGAQLVQEIFEENRSELLHGAIVWIPMLPADSLEPARRRELMFSDTRLKQYWDPDRIFGQLLSQTLNLTISIAWDVYLLYPADHPWNAELPPIPQFWMHQQNEDMSLYLDSARFR